MEQSVHRRKLANLIISPKSLMRVSIPFLTLAVISIGVVYAIHRKVIGALEKMELYGLENIPAMNSLYELQSSITQIGIIGLIAVCLACIAFWIVYSHRIFGPTVPMRRHIQSLTNGDYSSRIHPRSGDEFKELIEDMNQLAEALAKKSR